MSKSTLPAISTALIAAREQAGMSSHDISIKTHIRPVYIQAIEEGQFDALPGAVYLDAYVKTYAKYVGLDEETALQLLHEKEVHFAEGVSVDVPNLHKEPYRPPGLLLAGIILAIIAVFLMLYILRPPVRVAEDSVENQRYMDMLAQDQVKLFIRAQKDTVIELMEEPFTLEANTWHALPALDKYQITLPDIKDIALRTEGYELQDLAPLQAEKHLLVFTPYDVIALTNMKDTP